MSGSIFHCISAISIGLGQKGNHSVGFLVLKTALVNFTIQAKDASFKGSVCVRHSEFAAESPPVLGRVLQCSSTNLFAVSGGDPKLALQTVWKRLGFCESAVHEVSMS